MFLPSFLEHSLPWYLFSPTTEAGQTTSTPSSGELLPIQVCSHSLGDFMEHNLLLQSQQKPSSKFQYSLWLHSSMHCPSPLAATLLQKVKFILRRDFSWFPWDSEDSCWVVALFMPTSSSQMLLSVMSFRLQFKNRWHSSLGFMTSAQYYKARVVQSCKTRSTKAEQLPPNTLTIFNRLREAEHHFSEQDGHPEQGNLNGNFFPHTHFGSIPRPSLL